LPRIALILNPRANRGRAAKQGAALRQILEGALEEDSQVELLQTSAPGDASKLAADAAHRSVDMVIAVGGDGTVHEVVNGLMATDADSRPTMGLLPVGSGNDFAFASGITGCPKELANQIQRNLMRMVDVGHVESDTGRSCFCANNLGILLEGQINLASHQLNWPKGSGLYIRAALQTLIHKPPVARLQLTCDGTTRTLEAVTISIGNGPRSGGKFLLTPAAVIDDGLFNFAISKQASRLRLLVLALKSIGGRHLNDPHILLGQFTNMTIASDLCLAIHIDGEPWARPEEEIRQLAIKVLPGALRLLC
jgi:diacylglycerol kinase (ATP)